MLKFRGHRLVSWAFKNYIFFLQNLKFQAAFEPVTQDRDFFVSNDIVRSKRQAEEFNAENNPDAKNMQNIFGELWQTLIESAKKLVKTAASAMDRAGSKAEVQQR